MSIAAKVVAPSILDLINKTCELPTLPRALVKLNEVIANPETSADDVAAVIALDPPLATNILRIVNSAYYGLQVRVGSVNLAVSIMGFNMTKKVALEAAVFNQFARRDARASGHFDPAAFWEHSVYTGIVARIIGKSSPGCADLHPEDIYLCGLLHDVGKIILLENEPDAFQRALNTSVEQQRQVSEVEREQFGFTHADVGSVLAIKWFLPDDLAIAIRYHENPQLDPFENRLSTLIGVADRLASRHGRPAVPAAPIPDLGDGDVAALGIAASDLDEVLAEADEELATSGKPR